MAKIIRILNHNAVIVHEVSSNRVLLLLDKGIGFGRKLNEQMDAPYSGRVYELQKDTSKGRPGTCSAIWNRCIWK